MSLGFDSFSCEVNNSLKYIIFIKNKTRFKFCLPPTAGSLWDGQEQDRDTSSGKSQTDRLEGVLGGQSTKKSWVLEERGKKNEELRT